MDPEIPPFTLDYVTTEQTTFISIQGDLYINRSVPIRSTVNMSCLYDGKYNDNNSYTTNIYKHLKPHIHVKGYQLSLTLLSLS